MINELTDDNYYSAIDDEFQIISLLNGYVILFLN